MKNDKVTRCFQRFTHDERTARAASFRTGHNQKIAVGEFYYIHADLPNVCFRSRKEAIEVARYYAENPCEVTQ